MQQPPTRLKLSMYPPPICPECHKPLLLVPETEYLTYLFNAKTGRYEPDGTLEIGDCQNCGTDVSDLFLDGVCNYQSTKTFKKGE